MATKESLEQREFAELIISVDDARDPADPFKLSPELRASVATRLANVVAADAAMFMTEGDRLIASDLVTTAVENLKRLLHDGYNHIKAIPSVSITDGQRLGLFTSYGWSQGEIGRLTPARVEELANLAQVVTPTVSEPTWRYPDAVMTAITAELATLNANQPLAKTGDRQQATNSRDAALDLLRRVNSRVRYFYCGASDDLDYTTQLALIGRQPRRRPGEAGGGGEEAQLELPAVPGTATFDEASLTLSIPELPEHATTIRAYRQLTSGGEPELAGTSTTTTVSVIGVGPLEAGQEYNVWVVGHNATDNGPPSNVITFIAPV